MTDNPYLAVHISLAQTRANLLRMEVEKLRTPEPAKDAGTCIKILEALIRVEEQVADGLTACAQSTIS